MLRSLILAPCALWLALPALAGSTLDVPGTYPTIADALAAATSGDTVLVQPGTYAEFDLTFGGKDLVLLSAGGADVTTIDAGGLGRLLVFDSAEPVTATVEGFTLRGGRAPDGADATFSWWGDSGEDGGGVLIAPDASWNPSSATFRGCVFVDNEAGTGGKGYEGDQGYSGTQSYGGGPGGLGWAGGSGGDGGAISAWLGTLVVEDCRFTDNRGGLGGEGGKGGRGGGGWSGPFGTGTPAGNGGQGGTGGAGGDGGAIAMDTGDLVVSGCVFHANASGLGGPGGLGGQGGSGGSSGGHTGSPGQLGTAGDGGAVASIGLTLTMTSCTLAGNTFDNALYGGVIHAGVGTLRNCLVWGNDLPSFSTLSALATSYCDIEGLLPSGPGDLDADPLFADLAAGDLHLTTGSPCLHVGDPDTSGLLPHDMDGEPRLTGTGVDIGADEAWWELMGTGEDLLLETQVNQGGGVYLTPKTALTGDDVTVRFHSPGGTFVGGLPWLVVQGFNTGSILGPDPFNPGLVCDTTAGNLSLIQFGGGPLGPWLLPPGGLTGLFQVAPGLTGLSVRFQAIVVSPAARNGIYATTDGLDVVLQ